MRVYNYAISRLTDKRDRAHTTSSVLSTLDDKLTGLASQAAAKHKQEEDYEKDLAATIKQVQDKQKDSRTGLKRDSKSNVSRPDKDKDSMEVDEPVEPKGKNKKYAVFSHFGLSC